MADSSGAVELGGTPGPAPARRTAPTIPTKPGPPPKAHTARLPAPAEPEAQDLSEHQPVADGQKLVVPARRSEVQPGNEAAATRLEEARQRSHQLARELAQVGAGIDGVSVINMRLGLIMNALWPPSTRQGQLRQIQLETKFEEELIEQMTPMVSKARQLMLAAGTMPVQALEQLAEELGMGISAPAAEQLRQQQGPPPGKEH